MSKERDCWRFELDEAKKNAGLKEISLAVEKKKIRYSPSFAACIAEQLRYQSFLSWSIQGGVLLLALLLGLKIHGSHMETAEVAALSSAFMAFSANLFLSGMGTLFSRNMAELEQTLYFNLKQMVCIQILKAGTADLLILALMVILAGDQMAAGVWTYLLYLTVPFLWSNILYLHLLTAMRGRRGAGTAPGRNDTGGMAYRQLSADVICGIVAAAPVVFKNVYDTAYLPVWWGAVVAGIFVLVLEIRRLFKEIEGGEQLCLN